MKAFSVTNTIDAPPERVWAVLTDAPCIPEWDPGLDRIEGSIRPGERIRVFTRLSPERAFPVRVTEFVPNERMVWSGGLPLGAFRGVRTFTLTPRDGGRTEFTMREVFTGWMFPIIGRTLPDLTSAFGAFAAGLKARAERRG